MEFLVLLRLFFLTLASALFCVGYGMDEDAFGSRSK
jgi:hypothetical protein